MRLSRIYPLIPLLFLLSVWLIPAQAQGGTPTPTPAPTEPPAILVIQPTPVPEPPLQGNIWQQLQQAWDNNREDLLLLLLVPLFTGGFLVILFQRANTKLADMMGRLFHFLFDRFASTPFIRWRYEKEYRHTLASAVRYLQGGLLVDKEIPLDKMYVQALLTEETHPDMPDDLADHYRTRDELRRQQQKRSVGPWEAVRLFTRFVVLGGPGIGKTTCLRHLAYLCAQRQRPEVEHHLPIFIRFSELLPDLGKIERLEDVFPRILANYNFPNARPFIARELKNGRCLILLDGLDEVPGADQHQQLVELVQDFANRHVGERSTLPTASHNILVVSCRKYSYEHRQQLEGFKTTEVMEFDVPAIERFAYNWFTPDNALADELITVLKGNKRFLELARNPLLLLLITAHYERERHLPDQRADLYQNCIRTRIIRWNTKRGTHRGKFGDRNKEQLLEELALYLFREEKEGFIWRAKLLDWLTAFSQNLRLPAETTSEQLFEEIAVTSGLIQEWAIDRYGFSHHTLQEYFAAVAITNMERDEATALLAEHTEDPAWNEIILLYCGLTRNAGPFIQRLIEQASLPAASVHLWLLAGRCLAEGAQQVPALLQQQVAENLVYILKTPHAQTGYELTLAEMEQMGEALKLFAPHLLPDLLTPLIESQNLAYLLVAARLLPPSTPETLRELLNQRLLALARAVTATEEEKQSALAALGQLGVTSLVGTATLVENLQAKDAATRAEAARALGQQRGQIDNATSLALQQVYEQDTADKPRHAALESLLALGQAQAVGMVIIPAGEFIMGSDDIKGAKPQHRIYLPAYAIDRTPVTNAQYRRFIEAGGYGNPAYWKEAIAAGRWKEGNYVDYGGTSFKQPRYWDDKKWNGDHQPVVGVSWYEAMAYARWAGKRLPTEAEWEKAARGTDGRLYPWGNEWIDGRANSKESKIEKTSPVGQFSPAGDSPYGIADMAGNVWEWCSTRWWNEKQKEYAYPYTPDDGREDLSGGDIIVRVLRGGSWANDKDASRGAFRFRRIPWSGNGNWGFRCCSAPSSLSSGSDS